MVNKLQKYRMEYDKNTARIARYKERNVALERMISEEENLEIRTLMRSENITMDELIALARSRKVDQKPAYPDEDTEDKTEDYDDEDDE